MQSNQLNQSNQFNQSTQFTQFNQSSQLNQSSQFNEFSFNQNSRKDGYITYENFDETMLSCSLPEKKQVPNSKETYYHIMPYLYNYGTKDNRFLGEFFLEGCELTSTRGIISKPNPQGRIEHSILCKFDDSDENKKFLSVFDKIFKVSANFLFKNKGTVKMPLFNEMMAEATGFKYPIYKPTDSITGEVDDSKSSSIFFKLFSRGTVNKEQTLFTDLNKKPIPWFLLNDVTIKFIPLLHFKRTFIGGNGRALIQIEMESAIITSIIACGSLTKQISTIDKLNQQNPILNDLVSSQLARLSASRQDQVNEKSEEADDNKPMFSNISSNSSSSSDGFSEMLNNVPTRQQTMQFN